MKKLIFVLCLVLLACAGIVIYKNWRHHLLRKKIPQLVFLESDSLYRITYGDVYMDEIEGEIIIKNLQLQPDTTHKRSNDNSLPRELLQLTVPEIHITGVQTDDALLNREISATKIAIINPVVTMFNNHRIPKKLNTAGTTGSIYKVLLRGLEKISVDTILITGADYHICKWPAGDTVFSGRTINAHLHQLNISDSTSTDSSRVLFAKKAELTVDQILIRNKNQRYHYRFTNIQLRSAERVFTSQKISIAPLLGEAAFMRNAQWQTDRLDFDFTNIHLNRVNVQELLEGNLIADELTVRNASFKIYRDKSYPHPKKSKLGNYPHQRLMRIPVEVAIKKVIFQNGYIEYKEKNPRTGSNGLVHFNNVQATVLNVTNRYPDLNRSSFCTVHFNSRFLNKIPLSATLQLYLTNDNGKFTASGTMGAVDATIFNRLSKPMALVAIQSGHIQQLFFQLTCNDRLANGTVRLLYSDLKIKLLKTGAADNEYAVNGLASFLANASILNNNPAKNKQARVAAVSHPRDVYKSMFSLIWKSIFTGVQKTVGIE